MRRFTLRLAFAVFIVLTRLYGCVSSPDSTSESTSPTTTPSPVATLQSLQVNAAETTLAAGFTLQLTASGTYSDNSVQDVTSRVAWSSSDAAVAAVSASGQVSALAPGNVAFTATLDGISGSASLTITGATLTGVQVRPINPSLATASQLQLQALAAFDDQSDLDVTSRAVWATTNGTITAEGLLTAGGPGTGTVSASFGGFTGTTNLTVTGATLASIRITPANPLLAPGGRLLLTAVGVYSDGSEQELPRATWTTSNPASVTVDPTGLLQGVALGSSVITAQLNGISGTTTATVDGLVSLSVLPANARVATEASLPYTAVGTFSGGGTQDLTRGVHWSSSDPGVASIAQTGVATGVKTGSTSITAQSGGVSGSTPLTVQSPGVIPTPPPDDPKYFQILIDERVETDEVVHYTYVAGTLGLNSPVKLNSTWLTGGGAQNDDYTQPVMQVLSSATGNASANFLTTYDFTAADLPLDPSGRYRVLKIPFLDPGNNAQSNAGSGRLYFTLNAPAVMQVNATGPGGFSVAQPSPADNGAGSTHRFDFLELNCATPVSNGKNVCFVNTTNVDFFSLGVNVQGRQSDGALATFGLDLSGSRPVSSTISALKALAGNFGTGSRSSGGVFTRFLAPDLSFPNNATDLDTAIAAGYAFYATTPLSFQVNGVQYTATTVGNVLTFTAPTAFTIPLPTTLNVIAATGPLDVTGNAAAVGDGQKFVAAYLNRGVFTDTSLWNTPTAFYPPGVQSNLYASLLHQRFLNGAVYGFSFDDVPSSILTAPAIKTCTSMTLVVDEE